MEDDSLDEILQKALKHSSQLHEWRNSQPYDGVAGQLPEWAPEWHKNEFRKIRDKLLDTPLYGEEVSRENIIRWMDDYCALDGLQEGASWGGFIPPEVWGDVGYLAHIRYSVSLDEEKGLLLLAGDDAVSGLRSRQGYKKRDEYQDKKDFQTIAKRLWAANPTATIAALEWSPELAAYANKYKGRHTLRNWLSEIDPRPPEDKCGRPKKTK